MRGSGTGDDEMPRGSSGGVAAASSAIAQAACCPRRFLSARPSLLPTHSQPLLTSAWGSLPSPSACSRQATQTHHGGKTGAAAVWVRIDGRRHHPFLGSLAKASPAHTRSRRDPRCLSSFVDKPRHSTARVDGALRARGLPSHAHNSRGQLSAAKGHSRMRRVPGETSWAVGSGGVCINTISFPPSAFICVSPSCFCCLSSPWRKKRVYPDQAFRCCFLVLVPVHLPSGIQQKTEETSLRPLV